MNSVLGQSQASDGLTSILIQKWSIDTFVGNGGAYGPTVLSDPKRGRLTIAASFPQGAQWGVGEALFMAANAEISIDAGAPILTVGDSELVASQFLNPGYVEAVNTPLGVGTITNPGWVANVVPASLSARSGLSIMSFDVKRYTGPIFLCSLLNRLTITMISETW